MVGSCSRDGGSVKTASIGGDTSQGLVVMHVSSPAKMWQFLLWEEHFFNNWWQWQLQHRRN